MLDCALETVICDADLAGGSDGGEVSGDDAQEGGSASEEGDSELEELDLPPLDAFDEETRGAVDDFCSSAIGPEAFAQPSQELAESAKQGLKVSACLSCTAKGLPIATTLPQEGVQLYMDNPALRGLRRGGGVNYSTYWCDHQSLFPGLKAVFVGYPAFFYPNTCGWSSRTRVARRRKSK
jgi:hypothetical protein